MKDEKIIIEYKVKTEYSDKEEIIDVLIDLKDLEEDPDKSLYWEINNSLEEYGSENYCSCSFSESQNHCDCDCGDWSGEWKIVARNVIQNQ